MSEHETLEQIAERLTIGAALRTPYEQEALILAALGEVEQRAMTHVIVSTAPVVGDWQRRAEKAEAENARLREALTTAQVRANELAAEAKRLRDALSELLESPASFEDSRLDYAERQVDTKVWDEAKAALAPPAKEPKP
jgi:phosphohistidine phosphatase SixA